MAAESLAKAQAVYYMANAAFPQSFDELDISMGKPIRETLIPVEGYGNQLQFEWKWGRCNLSLYNNSDRIQCSSSASNVPQYTIYKKQKRKHCHVMPPDNKTQQRICQNETGLSGPTSAGSQYWTYNYP